MYVLALTMIIPLHDTFGYDLTYTPQISLDVNYHDNIFFTAEKPTSDTLSIVSGGTSLNLSSERDDFSFNGIVKNTSYLRNHELDDTDFFITAKASHMISERTGIESDIGLKKDSSPDRDLESTGLALGTSVRNTLNYSFKETYSLSELMNTDITYGFESQKFDSNQFTDSTSQNGDLGYTIDAGSMLPDTSFRLDLLYERDKYLDSLLEKAENYEWRAGASHQMTELLNFSFYLGTRQTSSTYLVPTWFEVFEEQSHSRGMIGQAALVYKTEYTDSTVSLSRNIDSVSGESRLSERTMATIDSSLSISRTVQTTFSAQYIMNKENEDNVSQENIRQRTVNFSPGLRIELSDDFFLSLSHVYTQLRDRNNDAITRRNLSTLRIEYRHSFFN